MDILQAIILGIVQGITEWLPISSKSHLIIFEHLFGLSQPVIFDLMLHMGSLCVVFFVFWKDIRELAIGIFHGEREKLRLLLFIALATVPIALVGYIFNDFIEETLRNLYVLGFGFLFTATMLFLSRYPKKKVRRIAVIDSIVIGVSQAAALFPGVSRSGTTISSGMILGIRKEDVARFSFLIFIPAILGATVLELPGLSAIDNIPALIVGTAVSAIVGYFSLKLLLDLIQKDRFSWFGIYCLVLGLVVLGIAYI